MRGDVVSWRVRDWYGSLLGNGYMVWCVDEGVIGGWRGGWLLIDGGIDAWDIVRSMDKSVLFTDGVCSLFGWIVYLWTFRVFLFDK